MNCLPVRSLRNDLVPALRWARDHDESCKRKMERARQTTLHALETFIDTDGIFKLVRPRIGYFTSCGIDVYDAIGSFFAVAGGDGHLVEVGFTGEGGKGP